MFLLTSHLALPQTLSVVNEIYMFNHKINVVDVFCFGWISLNRTQGRWAFLKNELCPLDQQSQFDENRHLLNKKVVMENK